MILTYENKQVQCVIKNENEHQQRHWVHGNFYETQRGGLLNWVYKQGFKNILDIGASIGNHTLFFTGIMGAKVHSIEPYLPSFNHLSENVKLNNFDVTLHNVGISSHKHMAKMLPVSDNNIGMVQVREGNETQMISMEILLNEHLDYIKIDVEHYNKEVLAGANMLHKINPVLSIECETKQILSQTDKIMQSYGYKMIPKLKFNHTPTYIWIK